MRVFNYSNIDEKLFDKEIISLPTEPQDKTFVQEIILEIDKKI